jgi:hypothetical protein
MEHDSNAEKRLWVSGLPKHGADKDALAELVDEDHDAAETEHYENAADPTYLAVETARRRYRAMFRRRLRHLPDTSEGVE